MLARKGGGSVNLSSQQEIGVELFLRATGSGFLSGWAGTGKTTVTTCAVGQATEALDLCATTGIAALNMQDQFRARTGLTLKTHTIYRWSGIGLGPNRGQSFEDYWSFLNLNMTRSRRAAFNRIRSAHTVVIDEVSMLPGRILSFLDFVCRRVREQPKTPFGGIKFVFVGDFLQLPPVAKDRNYDWAFMSETWAEAVKWNCYLTQTFRQNEPEFVQVLNDFRIGRVRGETAQILASRVARFPDRNIPRLMTHNAQVDKWNAYQLECIENEESHYFEAHTDGPTDQVDFLINNLTTPQTLHLKRGARVMFTSNLTIDGDLIAANGEIGQVCDFRDGYIDIVKERGGEVVTVEPFTWRFDAQDENSAKYTQYPLRLAYALTIHKSQGLTLDRALIDIRAAREPGQAYVALSRVRSLSGLFLKDWFSGVFVSEEAIRFYRELEKHNTAAA